VAYRAANDALLLIDEKATTFVDPGPAESMIID
jgi:hypothetical protein